MAQIAPAVSHQLSAQAHSASSLPIMSALTSRVLVASSAMPMVSRADNAIEAALLVRDQQLISVSAAWLTHI